MKIAMVLTNAFHPDMRVYKEAQYLISQGHDVTILALDSKEEFKETAPVQDIDGIHVVRFFCRNKKWDARIQRGGLWGKLRKLIYVRWYFDFIRQIRAYLKDHPCDMLHGHDMDGVYACLRVAGQHTPVVFDMHEMYEEQTPFRMKIRRLVRLFVNHCATKCRWLVYVVDRQLVMVKQKNKDKAIFLPNYPQLDTLEARTKTPNASLRVNYLGMLRGQVRMFKILFDACRNMPDVSIHIHGRGGDYDALKSLESQYNNVWIMGPYNGAADSSRLYAESDILYMAYEHTPVDEYRQPVKFFEAVATHTPYIAHPAAYTGRYAQEHGIGWATDIYDESAVRELIGSIARDRSLLKEKSLAFDRLTDLFSWEQVVKNLDHIYPPVTTQGERL